MDAERQPRLDRKDRTKLVAGRPVLDPFFLDIGRRNGPGLIEKLFGGARNALFEHKRALPLHHVEIALAALAAADFAVVFETAALDTAGQFGLLLATVFGYGIVAQIARP